MKILAQILICLLAFAPLAAAADLTVPDYAKFGVTRLNVNEIQIVNDYVPPYAAPNVEHELFLPPYSAIRDWALKRYQAVGNMGVAKVHILDASIRKEDLKIKKGAEGWFYDQVDGRYNMTVKVRLEIISPSYENMPYAEVNVTRKVETTEGMTLNQRDRELHEMVIDMLSDLDRVMAKSIQENISNVVR